LSQPTAEPLTSASDFRLSTGELAPVARSYGPVVPAVRGSRPDPFRTEDLDRDLKGRAVRGGGAVAAAQGALLLIQCVSVPIMARLLTPADFGLVAMVTALTGFISVFEDAGLSVATVQRARITHAQVSTLFWINAALGIVLMALTACLAPAIAWFYGEPRLIAITLALSAIMAIGSLNVQHRALLERQMCFATLGMISVASRVVGFATGVSVALLGGGYWALVATPLAAGAAGSVLVWRASGWRPGPPVRGSGVRPMLAFGAHFTGSKLLLYTRRNVDNVLIGYTWGATILGIYAKAYSLLMLPFQLVLGPIATVTIPTLSRLQDAPERFVRCFRRATELVALLATPISVFAFVAVQEVILAVLGDQWLDCGPIFQVLAPTAFVSTIAGGSAWVLVSLGQTARQLRFGVWQTIATVAGIGAGLPWGALGVAFGFTIISIPVNLAYMAYALHNSPASIFDVLRGMWRSAVASVAAAGVLVSARWTVPMNRGPVVDFGALLLTFFVAYGATLFFLPGGRRAVGDLFQLLAAVLRRPAELSPPSTH